MKWALVTIVAILLLLLFISLIKLKVKIDILHSQDNDHIKVKVMALFGLISYTYNVPLVKIDKDTASVVVENQQQLGEDHNPATSTSSKNKITPNKMLEKIQQAKEFLHHVIHLHAIVKRFMSHITIHHFEWKSSLGLGDAAYTGTAIGVLWSLKGGLVGIVSQYMKLKTKPDLSVTPFFQESISHTRFQCIFSFRIGYAIGAALRIVKYWKSNKGGKQYVRTSDRRFDDNSYGKLKAND